MKAGDKVWKPKGYKFEAVVIGVCETTSGETRIIAENGDGLIHIFAPNQLELKNA